jgi:hypothetical protein
VTSVPVKKLRSFPARPSGANTTSPRREWAMTPFGEDTYVGPSPNPGPRDRDDPHGGDAAYMLWPFKLIVGRVQQSGWCKCRPAACAV